MCICVYIYIIYIHTYRQWHVKAVNLSLLKSTVLKMLPCSSRMPFGTFLSTAVTTGFFWFFNLAQGKSRTTKHRIIRLNSIQKKKKNQINTLAHVPVRCHNLSSLPFKALKAAFSH